MIAVASAFCALALLAFILFAAGSMNASQRAAEDEQRMIRRILEGDMRQAQVMDPSSHNNRSI